LADRRGAGAAGGGEPEVPFELIRRSRSGRGPQAGASFFRPATEERPSRFACEPRSPIGAGFGARVGVESGRREGGRDYGGEARALGAGSANPQRQREIHRGKPRSPHFSRSQVYI